MKNPTAVLAKMINRMPSYMHPDFSLINNLADLDFQNAHEIDLAEANELEPAWTKKQLHRAKMYAAEVHIQAQQFIHDHPEQVDDLNYAQGDVCGECGGPK